MTTVNTPAIAISQAPNTLPEQNAVSATSAPPTYFDEPPHYNFQDMTLADQKELLQDAKSDISASSSQGTLALPSTFVPSKTLFINAQGIGIWRFPIPSSELQIPITNENGDVIYISTRAKRSSGNAVLSNAEGKELVASEYRFGPGKNPKLNLLGKGGIEGDEISAKGKWTSRTQDFSFAGGQTVFTWRYVREVDPASGDKKKKRSFLVMEVAMTTAEVVPDSKGKNKEKKGSGVRRVAQLIRNDESRTPGTKSCSAGNGGELVIDEAALESTSVEKEIVVASCLMMLKKEIDRRRSIQMAMIVAAASGGS